MRGVLASWRPHAGPQMRRALPSVAVAAALVPLLAGCGNSIDGEQLRLCRSVISALNPDGTELREMRYGSSAPGSDGVRIDYVARPPGEASHVRYVVCGFAGRTFSADRLELVAVETDTGPVPAAPGWPVRAGRSGARTGRAGV